MDGLISCFGLFSHFISSIFIVSDWFHKIYCYNNMFMLTGCNKLISFLLVVELLLINEFVFISEMKSNELIQQSTSMKSIAAIKLISLIFFSAIIHSSSERSLKCKQFAHSFLLWWLLAFIHHYAFWIKAAQLPSHFWNSTVWNSRNHKAKWKQLKWNEGASQTSSCSLSFSLRECF